MCIRDRCIQHRFPACFVGLATRAYSPARPFAIGGIVEGPYFVNQLIMAGCSSATRLIGIAAVEAVG
eukprot:5162359-Pyramimonas_sp.AAC.1